MLQNAMSRCSSRLTAFVLQTVKHRKVRLNLKKLYSLLLVQTPTWLRLEKKSRQYDNKVYNLLKAEDLPNQFR